MAVYLKLFHGRHTVDEELDDWGFEGPTIGPLKFCHITYLSDVKFAMANEAFREFFPEKTAEWEALDVANLNHEWIDHHLNTTNDLIEFQGKFYGDFSIIDEDAIAVPQPVSLTCFFVYMEGVELPPVFVWANDKEEASYQYTNHLRKQGQTRWGTLHIHNIPRNFGVVTAKVVTSHGWTAKPEIAGDKN